jgi:glycosyltransferase involved in cell wall biosynthesis
VHIHALWSYASVAAARAARAADVPYVVRPAGMLSQYTLARNAWKKRLYWRFLEQATVRGAAAFHATSTGERDDILRIRPDAQVHVIPNGVDDAAWTTPATPRGESDYFNGIEPDCPVVLFLSRLHPKKGIVDLLLPAWSQLDTNAVLVIAGGPDAHLLEHAQDVHATVSRLGLSERVLLLGEIPANRRWELYDGADLFILPSHSENFGNVVAESMARGCPVIVTDQVQASEHVLAAAAGAIVPCTVQALVEALREYLADASLRKRCGNNGQSYATKHLRWEQIAVCTRELYTATLSSREHLLTPA